MGFPIICMTTRMGLLLYRRRALYAKGVFMKTFSRFWIITFMVLIIFSMAGCLSLGGGGSVKKVIAAYQGNASKEECARVYIGPYVQVVGVNEKMSPMKYISTGNDVILIPPGKSTVNVNHVHSRGYDEPRYPGEKLTFTAEAGKIYIVSTNNFSSGTILATLLEFRVQELESADEEVLRNHYIFSGFTPFAVKGDIKPKIEEAVNLQ